MTDASAPPEEGLSLHLVAGSAGERRPQPTWEHARVLGHENIGTRYHRLALATPTITAAARAGQFVMITVGDGRGGHLPLPRPMAIHRRRIERGSIEIIFDVVGAGTAALARAAAGDSLTVMGPLGNGFGSDGWGPGDRVLLLGRGIGVCGVMTAAEDARRHGAAPVAFFSARDRECVIGMDDAMQLGFEAVAVDDRSGTSHPAALRPTLSKRFATCPPAAVLVCGSRRLGLLAAALGRDWGVPVSVSVEARMACGIGYCHGCALATGPGDDEGPLVCSDGPVFSLVWKSAVGGAGVQY